MKTPAAFLVLLLALDGARAAEEQSHGVEFERRVIDQMLGRDYTEEWDIPAAANAKHPGIPASIKLIEAGNPVYLGDASRQRAHTEPFELIVGFYEKKPSSDQLRIVALYDLMIDPKVWEKLWGQITPKDLDEFSDAVKLGPLEKARYFAQSEVIRLRDKSGGMDINPKLDANQRRIQCSIPFDLFHTVLVGKPPVRQQQIVLWGEPFPETFRLGERSQVAAQPSAPVQRQPLTPAQKAAAKNAAAKGIEEHVETIYVPPTMVNGEGQRVPAKDREVTTNGMVIIPPTVEMSPLPSSSSKVATVPSVGTAPAPAQTQYQIPPPAATTSTQLPPSVPEMLPPEKAGLPPVEMEWPKIDMEPVNVPAKK
jgi:hypothetical protein